MREIPRTLIICIMAFFVIVPLIVLIGWALSTSWPYPDLVPKNLSLDGLIDYLGKPTTTRAIVNSIQLSLIVTAGSLLLGYMP